MKHITSLDSLVVQWDESNNCSIDTLNITLNRKRLYYIVQYQPLKTALHCHENLTLLVSCSLFSFQASQDAVLLKAAQNKTVIHI